MSGRGQAIIPAVVAALWSYVVLDFAIHAVVLASWWRDAGAFSLSSIEMAKRIPVGYASFAIYCLGLCLLLASERWARATVLIGARLGAVVGAAFGLTFALGVYSIARVPRSFLLLGPVTTAICSAAAGGTAAWILTGVRRWRRVGLVVIGGLVVLILAVVAQNVLHIYPSSQEVVEP